MIVQIQLLPDPERWSSITHVGEGGTAGCVTGLSQESRNDGPDPPGGSRLQEDVSDLLRQVTCNQTVTRVQHGSDRCHSCCMATYQMQKKWVRGCGRRDGGGGEGVKSLQNPKAEGGGGHWVPEPDQSQPSNVLFPLAMCHIAPATIDSPHVSP